MCSPHVTVLVFGPAVPFFKVHNARSHADMVGRDASLTERLRAEHAHRELRNIGIGIEGIRPRSVFRVRRPKIVQAAAFAVTFNSNLVTTDTGDVAAVHYDPNVAISLTDALPISAVITLPLSAIPYPDYTYRKTNGSLSGAETISMWASADSSTTIPNDLVLFRRVNNGPISVVTRGIELPAASRYSNTPASIR